MMTRRIALICALMIGSACTAAAQTKIAIGMPPIAEVQAAFVAQEEGFFKKHGLEVEFLPTGSNQTLVGAVVSGSHQFVSVSPTVLLQAIDGGIDLVAVANCGVTSPRTAVNYGLAVREGVQIKEPADLKGKKVGGPGIGGTLDIFFRQWLAQNKMSPKDMTFIEVPIPSTADVLKGGNIDAVIAGQPSLGRAVDLSKGYVAFNFTKDLPQNLPLTGFVAMREWATKNPGAVKAFRAALVDAAAFVKANPDKTKEYVIKYTRLPPPVVQRMELPECNAVATKEQFAWFDQAMRAQDLLRGKIDLDKVIAP